MSKFFAACTPNSLPLGDGGTEHGYQLTVLDESLTALLTVDLPDWKTFRLEEMDERLDRAGYALESPDSGWTPAGVGFMAPVVRTSREGA